MDQPIYSPSLGEATSRFLPPKPLQKGSSGTKATAAGMAEFPARRRTARAWQLCTYVGGFFVIVDVVNVSSEAKISYFHHIVFSD